MTTGAGAVTVGQPGGCRDHKQCRGDRVRWAALCELSLESWEPAPWTTSDVLMLGCAWVYSEGDADLLKGIGQGCEEAEFRF